MASDTITSKETLFEEIQLQLFPKVNLPSLIAACKSDAQLRKLTLQQLERLMGPSRKGGRPDAALANWMSNMFWTTDEGHHPSDSGNPLLDPSERVKMNDAERELCSFLVTLSGLCHDLCNDYLFSLDLVCPGAEGEYGWLYDFQVTNDNLVNFLKKTPYRLVAAHVAHIMVQQNALAIMNENDIVQDYLATGDEQPYQNFLKGSATPDDYVNCALTLMNHVQSHDDEADLLNLTDDELVIYDILQGELRAEKFDQTILLASKQIATYFAEAPEEQLNFEDFHSGFNTCTADILAQHDIQPSKLATAYLASLCRRRYENIYNNQLE